MQLTLLKMIQDQFWRRPKVEPAVCADLTGKTVVVVGASAKAGLGFEAAKHFASMNSERLVLCRSPLRGQAAVQGRCVRS